MSNGVFLISKDSELTEMSSSLYQSEDELQSLIAEFPRLISSSMDTENVSKWLLIAREVGVSDRLNGGSRWSVDHLFIDGEGVPILVEVKRSTDTRIRREVVGQMLDYAANAIAYWPIEHIQESFLAECRSKAVDPQEELERVIGVQIESVTFWQNVKTNLQAGRIRMIFVADEIPDELRRIIEFLNGQMDPAEVLGIEVKQYTANNLKTIVPSVIGRTASSDRKRPAGAVTAPREGLQEVVDAFNALDQEGLSAVGNAETFRQVRLPGFPAGLHYEFIHRRSSGVTAEFHIEMPKYQPVSSTLRRLAEQHVSIGSGTLVFDSTWKSGCGRLRVIFQSEASPSTVAEAMQELITLTRPEISKAIQACERNDQ